MDEYEFQETSESLIDMLHGNSSGCWSIVMTEKNNINWMSGGEHIVIESANMKYVIKQGYSEEVSAFH